MPETTAVATIQPAAEVLVSQSPGMSAMIEFAKEICQAKFITPAARGDKASVFYLIAMGQDLGLKWTHALRSIYMTPDGKAGMQGDVMLALLYQHKFTVKISSDEKGATVQIKRPDGSDPLPEGWSFTADDAKRIQVWKAGKDGEKGGWVALADKFNYKSWGKMMYVWRALAPCARFVASDLLGGIYLNEELDDIPPEDAASPVVEAPGPKVGRKAKAEPQPETKTDQAPEPTPVRTVEAEALPPEAETVARPATPTPAKAETKQPAAETKPAATEPKPEAALKARVEALIASVPEVSADTLRKRLNVFCRGFLGVSELPPPDKLSGAITMAEKLLASSQRAALLASPAHVGRAYGAGGETIRQMFESQDWAPATRTLAIDVMVAKSITPDGLLAYLKANGIDQCMDADASAFLRVALVTKEALQLVDLGAEYNRPLAHLVERLNELLGDAQEWETATVEAALVKLKGELQVPAAGAPGPQLVPPAEQPKEEPSKEDESGQTSWI